MYALGGRVYGSDENSLLKKCEYYDIDKNKWFLMPDMNVGRCTACGFVYWDKIWVFGGYTNWYKRSRKIEFFDENL